MDETLKLWKKKLFLQNETFKSGLTLSESLIFADLINFFCNNEGCLTRVGNDKARDITTWDYGHLTPVASDFLAKNLLVKIVLGLPISLPKSSYRDCAMTARECVPLFSRRLSEADH